MREDIRAELDRAIADVKAQQGRDTMPGYELAPLLPEHLRQPFWELMLDQYFREQLGDEYEEIRGGGS